MIRLAARICGSLPYLLSVLASIIFLMVIASEESDFAVFLGFMLMVGGFKPYLWGRRYIATHPLYYPPQKPHVRKARYQVKQLKLKPPPVVKQAIERPRKGKSVHWTQTIAHLSPAMAELVVQGYQQAERELDASEADTPQEIT